MKKQMILCAAVVLTAFALSAYGITLTLDRNYSGAPAPKTVATDGQGCLTGAPLPVPKRAGYVFRGWFTAQAAGGAQVIAGAAGHGSWWGQRLPSAEVIKAAKSGGAGSGVMLHEIGHGFGLYDFYGAVRIMPEAGAPDCVGRSVPPITLI